MNILLVDGSVVSTIQARHVSELAHGLLDRGHRVTVACGCTKAYKNLRELGIELVQVEFGCKSAVGAFAQLFKHIKENHYDVVHTHGVCAGLVGRFAAKFAANVKIIHTVHATPEDVVASQGAIADIQRRCYGNADRFLSRWTDTIITVSGDLRRRSIRSGIHHEKIETVQSGIDVASFKRMDAVAARRKFMIPSGCRVVGTVAPVAKTDSSIAEIIRAAKFVARNYDDVVFAVIGNSPKIPNLKRMARESGVEHRMVFVGDCEDASEALSAFDLFVVASQWEGHHLAVLEAMAAGIPVVAPFGNVLREIVVDGVTGRLVTEGEHDSIADAICRIFDEGRSLMMGMAGQERASRYFSLDKMVEQIESVYIGGIRRSTQGVTASVLR